MNKKIAFPIVLFVISIFFFIGSARMKFDLRQWELQWGF